MTTVPEKEVESPKREREGILEKISPEGPNEDR